ncbi:MAG: hypothetical protein F4Z85_15635 [Gemmatimonadetes bacterium]|nr:hypothetical protein [Gemmatimonadota bacterium]MYB67292.1 hypothetical protein [Gemmatimonadota bacterium]
MGLSRNFAAFDDLATRGGPLMLSPAHTWFGMDVWTDDRKPISGWLGWNISGSRGGDNLGSWVGFEIALRPVSQFELGIEPGYNFNRNFAQWIENKDEDGDSEDDHFIFGELESRVFEIGVRVT